MWKIFEDIKGWFVGPIPGQTQTMEMTNDQLITEIKKLYDQMEVFDLDANQMEKFRYVNLNDELVKRGYEVVQGSTGLSVVKIK